MSERMWEELQQARAERDAAIAERDRLRRELEALRDDVTRKAFAVGSYVAGRINAILRGEP